MNTRDTRPLAYILSILDSRLYDIKEYAIYIYLFIYLPISKEVL